MARSVRERAVVAVGAAVALVVGGYLLIVEPLVDRARAVEIRVPAREAALERRRLLVGQRARLAEELDAATARLELQSARLLRGPTPPLAASELQKVVKDLLPGSGVEIRSERVVQPADLDGLQEIGIELALVGSIRDTVTAISRLERADRLLALRDVRMRPVALAQPRELLTTLTVVGYLLRSGARGN